MRVQRHRREGFKDQHLLVLPAPLAAESKGHPLLRGLLVTDAGYFPRARLHLVERPLGAATELVILCLGGTGWVRCGGAARKMGAGDLTWLPAHEAHAYGSGEEAPWTIVWAHFQGAEVAAWRELLGVAGAARPAVLSLPDDRLEDLAFDRVHAALEGGFALRNLVAAAAALRHALSAAAALGTDHRDPRSADDRVAVSIELLRTDWLRPHRLAELATAAKESVAHYSVLFRRQTGFSPIDYLIRLRVRHACRMLDTTPLSVREIGERIGYQDPYYFTRCFRRVMGFSPRAYRKTLRG